VYLVLSGEVGFVKRGGQKKKKRLISQPPVSLYKS
jgi:hypothetical protein